MATSKRAGLLAAVAVLIGGCGGDQDQASSPKPPPARPDAGAERKPVAKPTPQAFVRENVNVPDSPLRVRPRSLGLVGATVTWYRSLRWSGWGEMTAQARGRVCTSAGVTCTPVTVRLSAVERLDGRRVYTCLRESSGGPQTCLPTKKTPADCGDLGSEGAGSGNIKASGVDCNTARGVAKQWESQCASQPDGSCTVSAGFACRFREAGYEAGVISCTAEDREVRFETGA